MKKYIPNQLFSYYGGKATLASTVTKLINQFDHNIYVEPFCGGASVFFSKIQNTPIKKNSIHVLNDQANSIVTAYRVAVEQPLELQKKLESSLYSEFLQRKANEIVKNTSEYSDLDIAWAVIYGIRSSFCSQLNGSWARSKKGNQQVAKYKNFLIYLPEVLESLRDVAISSEDAINCIKRWDSPQTLFYLDPPYPGTDQSHYSGYSQQDFDNLMKTINDIEGTVVLSCYPNDSVPSEWERYEITRKCSINFKDGITDSYRTEVIWVKPGNQMKRIKTDISAQNEKIRAFNLESENQLAA